MADRAQPAEPRRGPLLAFLRIWLPVLIAVGGLVYGATRGFDEVGIEAAVVLIAAALSLWFMNILLRAGFSGDLERDKEDAARDFFDAHGHWPDEPPPPAPRRRPVP